MMNTLKIFQILLILIIGIFLSFINCETVETELVNTEYGPVRGIREFTIYNNKPYFAFRGIPYAKPPIDELRFRPPQKPDRWNDTLLAFNYQSPCLQGIPGEDGESENCLYLNVYSPNVSALANLPVMIGIHGGAFIVGVANSIGPDFLFNEADMIVVTMNYRLGVLGFLSLNTTEYSGNMGLKDQLLAIRWVHENIHHFGGNSSRITLYGLSAGSASVHLHMLSPVSRPYFQQAILASGSALNPWVHSRVSEHIETMFRYAREMNNPVNNVTELIEYLKFVDGRNLTIFSLDVPTSFHRTGFDVPWTPVVEPIGSDEAFLTESPSKIMNSDLPKNITAIFSYCHEESYIFIDEQLRNNSLLDILNDIFDIQLPIYYMNEPFNTSSGQNPEIENEIRQFYFGDNNGQINADSLMGYSNLVSDTAFNYGIDRAVRLHAKNTSSSSSSSLEKGNIFYLKFSTVAAFNFMRWDTYAPYLGLPGATHADDQFYSVVNHDQYELSEIYKLFPIDSLERRTINVMAQIYATFIVYGNPGFAPVTNETVYYLDVTNDGLVDGFNPQSNSTQFWENLFDKFDMW